MIEGESALMCRLPISEPTTHRARCGFSTRKMPLLAVAHATEPSFRAYPLLARLGKAASEDLDMEGGDSQGPGIAERPSLNAQLKPPTRAGAGSQQTPRRTYILWACLAHGSWICQGVLGDLARAGRGQLSQAPALSGGGSMLLRGSREGCRQN